MGKEVRNRSLRLERAREGLLRMPWSCPVRAKVFAGPAGNPFWRL